MSTAASRFVSSRRLLGRELAVGKALAMLVAVVATVDWIRRAARVITEHDPAELQVLAQAGGVPHGTSYPLYMALLRAFIRLPFGTVAYRCNVFSALCGGLTLWLLAALVAQLDRRSPSRGWIAGAAGAAVIGASHTFTSVAIFTGMYTLHTAMALGVLVLLARWLSRGPSVRKGRDVEWALALCGAMLANHITTLALAPGVLALLGWGIWRDRSQLRHVLRGVLWAAIAVLVLDVLLFWVMWKNRVEYDHWWGIVLHARDFFEVTPAQAESFWYAWWYEATCRQFRFDSLGASWAQRVFQTKLVLPRMYAELSPLFTCLSVLGLGRLVHRRRFDLVVLATLVTAVHVLLATGYTATIKTHIYLLPVTLLLAALAAHGATWPLELVTKRRIPLRNSAGALVLVAAVLGLSAWSHRRFAESMLHDTAPAYAPIRAALGPRPDSRSEHAMLERARRIVDVLPPRALVLGDWTYIYPLHFVSRFERGTHELEVYDPFMYGRPERELVRDYAARLTDPARTERVFVLNPGYAPKVRGYHLVRRSPEVLEWLRDGEPQADASPPSLTR